MKTTKYIAVLLLVGLTVVGADSRPLIEHVGRSHSNGQTKTSAVAAGEWGGTGIGFTVEKNGVQIDFDCASGEIATRLRTDKAGNFRVSGVFIRRSMGATRLGTSQNREPAIFKGKITGSKLSVTITLAGSREVHGPFTATRGAAGSLHRCY